MYKLIINGIPCEWSRDDIEDIHKLIKVYKKQDKKAGRAQAEYIIVGGFN